MTDKAQHASHSMQQMDRSSTAASSTLNSIAETLRDWCSIKHWCKTKLKLQNSLLQTQQHNVSKPSYLLPMPAKQTLPMSIACL